MEGKSEVSMLAILITFSSILAVSLSARIGNPNTPVSDIVMHILLESILCALYIALLLVHANRMKVEAIREVGEQAAGIRDRVSDEISAMREEMRRVFKFMPTPCIKWEKVNGKFVMIAVNDEMVRRMGGEYADFIGKRAIELWSDRPDLVDDMRSCIENRETIEKVTPCKLWGMDKTADVQFKFTYFPPKYCLMYASFLNRSG